MEILSQKNRQVYAVINLMLYYPSFRRSDQSSQFRVRYSVVYTIYLIRGREDRVYARVCVYVYVSRMYIHTHTRICIYIQGGREKERESEREKVPNILFSSAHLQTFPMHESALQVGSNILCFT